jgi:hypothetical protein
VTATLAPGSTLISGLAETLASVTPVANYLFEQQAAAACSAPYEAPPVQNPSLVAKDSFFFSPIAVVLVAAPSSPAAQAIARAASRLNNATVDDEYVTPEDTIDLNDAVTKKQPSLDQIIEYLRAVRTAIRTVSAKFAALSAFEQVTKKLFFCYISLCFTLTYSVVMWCVSGNVGVGCDQSELSSYQSNDYRSIDVAGRLTGRIREFNVAISRFAAARFGSIASAGFVSDGRCLLCTCSCFFFSLHSTCDLFLIWMMIFYRLPCRARRIVPPSLDHRRTSTSLSRRLHYSHLSACVLRVLFALRPSCTRSRCLRRRCMLWPPVLRMPWVLLVRCGLDLTFSSSFALNIVFVAMDSKQLIL